MSKEKKTNERPDVDVMFDALVKSGVIKPDMTLKQLMEATKPMHGVEPRWGLVYNHGHWFFWWK